MTVNMSNIVLNGGISSKTCFISFMAFCTNYSRDHVPYLARQGRHVASTISPTHSYVVFLADYVELFVEWT